MQGTRREGSRRLERLVTQPDAVNQDQVPMAHKISVCKYLCQGSDNLLWFGRVWMQGFQYEDVAALRRVLSNEADAPYPGRRRLPAMVASVRANLGAQGVRALQGLVAQCLASEL